jgi:hypothetical protein
MSVFLGGINGIGKVLSVDSFTKFLKENGENPKLMEEEYFVYILLRYSKQLTGRKSLKGMSWNAIYKSNPKINDWISYYGLDGDNISKLIKQRAKLI